jgi:alpha-beta hydrolase superfamily lysophospholipase
MTYFTGAHGRVHHDAWLPEGEVRSVVVLLHGYGEHLGLYDALGRRLARDGHAVHALDCVGHGRSDGERASVETWDWYVDDARTLVRLARGLHPGLPVVVVGHSGGALAAYLLAVRHPGVVDGLVLSGAPLQPVGWLTEGALGDEPEGDDPDPTALFSTHADYVHALMHDELVHQGGFRTETLQAIVRTWPEVADALAAARPDVPVLLVHGELDPLVPAAHARFAACALPGATLRAFTGDLHDVLNEHDRDVVHEVVAEFV